MVRLHLTGRQNWDQLGTILYGPIALRVVQVDMFYIPGRLMIATNHIILYIQHRPKITYVTVVAPISRSSNETYD